MTKGKTQIYDALQKKYLRISEVGGIGNGISWEWKKRPLQGQNFDAIAVSELKYYTPRISGCSGKTTQLFIIILKIVLNSISARIVLRPSQIRLCIKSKSNEKDVRVLPVGFLDEILEQPPGAGGRSIA